MKLIEKKKLEMSVDFFVEVEEAEWKEANKFAFDKIARKTGAKLKIPGFRPGKAPVNEVKKYVNELEVVESATNHVIPNVLAFIEKTDEYINDDSETVDTPNLNVEKLEKDKLIVKVSYDLYPVVTISKYNDLILKINEIEVTDQEVEKELEHSQNVKALKTIKKTGQVELNDEVLFDFQGLLDGKPFEGGDAKNFSLQIGSNKFIPGFEEQMLGMQPGEQKTISITFPKDYHSEKLAGKDVTFNIKVHEITKVLKPELDDDFAVKLNLKNVQTINQAREYIKSKIHNSKIEHRNEKAWLELSKQLLERSTITTIPNTLLEREISTLKQQILAQLSQYQVDLKQYLSFSNKTEAEFNEDLKTQAKDTITLALIVDKIALENSIEVSDEEAYERVSEMARYYSGDRDQVIEQLNQNLDMVKEFLIHKKVTNFLIDLNKNNKPIDSNINNDLKELI